MKTSHQPVKTPLHLATFPSCSILPYSTSSSLCPIITSFFSFSTFLLLSLLLCFSVFLFSLSSSYLILLHLSRLSEVFPNYPKPLTYISNILLLSSHQTPSPLRVETLYSITSTSPMALNNVPCAQKILKMFLFN